jgi:hypothetical protein
MTSSLTSYYRDFMKFVATLLVGVVAAVITYVVASIAIPEIGAQRILAIIMGFVGFMLSYTYVLIQTIVQSKQDILGAIDARVSFRKYDKMADAVSYITKNAGDCKMIKNTRLSSPETKIMQGVLGSKVLAMDNAIIAAVKDGCDYDLVYDPRRKPDVVHYNEALKASPKNGERGEFTGYLIESHDKPLLQMVILHFRDDNHVSNAIS